MDIKRLQGESTLGTTKTARQVNPYQDNQAKTNQSIVAPGSSDTVQLSSMARQLSKISPIIEEDAAQRKSKIDSIKARIEDGSYNIDSKDVAGSILSYASDNSSAL
jgi:negative regulator of flagellin synthesis FlgM